MSRGWRCRLVAHRVQKKSNSNKKSTPDAELTVPSGHRKPMKDILDGNHDKTKSSKNKTRSIRLNRQRKDKFLLKNN